jgi:FkbM family methyltransferase
MLLGFVRPGDRILDIGANIGTFTIPLANLAGPDGCVFAFEADIEIFNVLVKNIDLNGCTETVCAINALVSQSDGSFKKIKRSGNMGGTKFIHDELEIGTDIKTINIDKWVNEKQLDDKCFDLIKIDAEGMDADVLYSCRGLIREHKPIVYVEIDKQSLQENGYTPRDVEDLLVGNGYHFFRNIGKRNSENDDYCIGRLPNVRTGGGFYDLLAIHPRSSRYPYKSKSRNYMTMHHNLNVLRKIPVRVRNYMRRKIT